MIYVGNDIIEVSRIDKVFSSYGNHFLNKIFSIQEKNIMKNKNNNPINIAGKFAAKEAAKKALLACPDLSLKHVSFKDIQILNKNNGCPYISFDFDRISESIYSVVNFQISISHTKEHAIATAVLELN